MTQQLAVKSPTDLLKSVAQIPKDVAVSPQIAQIVEHHQLRFVNHAISLLAEAAESLNHLQVVTNRRKFR